jgi:hypothetical protein
LNLKQTELQYCRLVWRHKWIQKALPT